MLGSVYFSAFRILRCTKEVLLALSMVTGKLKNYLVMVLSGYS